MRQRGGETRSVQEGAYQELWAASRGLEVSMRAKGEYLLKEERERKEE